jgi:hypothetical protein
MKFLSLLLATAAVVVGELNNLKQFYHTSSEIDNELHKLAKSCKALTIKHHKGPNGDATLTSAALKQAGGKEDKLKVLLFFGEHSRELVSSESGLSLIQHLCKQGKTDVPASLVDYNLENAEFLIFTNIGVNSRRHVERGKYCLRVNSHGVDLNRNWNDHWSNKGRGETYPGKKAFSEDETVVLRDLSKAFKPDVFLTVHSGTLGMYIPYAYSTNEVQGKTTPAMLDVLNKLNPKYCNCDVGAAGKQVGYLCPGTCLDFIYDMGTKYSFAFEIYENGRYKRKSGETASADAASCMLQKEPIGSIDQPPAHQHDTDDFADDEHEGHSHAHSHDHSHEFHFDKDTPPVSRHLLTKMIHKTTAKFPVPTGGNNAMCFRQFNPATQKQYTGSMKNWVSAYLELVQRVNEYHITAGQ